MTHCPISTDFWAVFSVQIIIVNKWCCRIYRSHGECMLKSGREIPFTFQNLDFICISILFAYLFSHSLYLFTSTDQCAKRKCAPWKCEKFAYTHRHTHIKTYCAFFPIFVYMFSPSSPPRSKHLLLFFFSQTIFPAGLTSSFWFCCWDALWSKLVILWLSLNINAISGDTSTPPIFQPNMAHILQTSSLFGCWSI